MAVTFDHPAAWFVTERDSYGHGQLVYQGTTVNVAAAPALDATKYEAVSPGETTEFTFGPVASLIHTISFYQGSIDAYNRIILLNRSNKPIGVIPGSVWPRDDGDEFAAASNRRVYITNLPADFYGIEFVSFGIAEEYDDIAVSSATFCSRNYNPCMDNGGVFPTVPRPSPSNPRPIPSHPPASVDGFAPIVAPEPEAWALMLVGFGGLGGLARARRGVPRAAHPAMLD